MGYSRFVEIGRVAMINYGDDYGKLCVIMDVLDHNRVRTFPPSQAVCRSAPPWRGGGALLADCTLDAQRPVAQCMVDGPTTGVPRGVMNFKRLSLTGITVPVARTNKTSTV